MTTLVDRVLKLYEEKSKNNKGLRVLIAIAGVPGAGKTTLAESLSKALNEHIGTVTISQDGYHLYRSELQVMQDPGEALRRRGAPFTFNAERFLNLVKKINDPSSEGEPIKVPSFDHKKKDPVEDDILIPPNARVILIEGNYVLLEDEIWKEIKDYADETWFVETDSSIVRDRLIRRHLNAGIATNEAEAIERAEGSDLQNAEYIKERSQVPDLIIMS